jgi:biotin carboxyl carrier protein
VSGDRCVAAVEREADGTLRVLAPAVGWWLEHPAADALLGPGSPIGVLRSLDRRFGLVLPDGAMGLAVGLPRRRIVAVGWGDTLLRLAPLAPALALATAGARAPAGETVHDLPAGGRPVVAPTDGIFYRRTAPGAPPFVEVGATVQDGQPVGLVEVMKTFNQVVYSGPPAEARVVEIRSEDGHEVRAGDVLVVVVGAEPGSSSTGSGSTSR